MIPISNAMAEEILIILGDLRRMAWDKKGNRASNMRRRAKIIINYINKKQNEQRNSNHPRKQLSRVG